MFQARAQIIAQAAVFLAVKVEEESKPLETVIKAFWEHRYRARPGRTSEQLTAARMRIQDERFLDMYKQCVLTGERALLYALAFDLSPCQQHSLLVPLFTECGWAHSEASPPEDKAEGRVLSQAAWNFMNDSLKTTVSLLYSPEEIACAVMLLTSRLFDRLDSMFKADGTAVWDARGLDLSRLEEIIEQVLDVYDAPLRVRASKGRDEAAAVAPLSTAARPEVNRQPSS